MRVPDFWNEQDYTARIARAVLSPISWTYGASVAWKRDLAQPYRAKAKVICIGNLTAGGSGKTPIVTSIAELLHERGRKPFILTRGYGGRLAGPLLVDPKMHNAIDVGDEPLLLARSAPVIVSRNRKSGAALADAEGADVIVMDDGFQNFQLAKDVSIVVVDAETGFGNGNVLPNGPLREPVAQGLARADAVLLVGDGDIALPEFERPVLRAHLKPDDTKAVAGTRVLAFAGIGRPEKFFASLLSVGAKLVGAEPFADHHIFTAADMARLRAKARDANARLITTEKDYVRLSGTDRDGIDTLPIRAEFDSPATLERLLDSIISPGIAAHHG